jgi:hypothetical protein
MSDNKGNNKSKPNLFTGFSTGTGLRLWLFFLFCFFFLGYPVPLSILLGFAGGIAGGWAMGWWKSSEGPRVVESQEEEDLDLEEQPRVSGLRLAKQRRDNRSRKRTQKPQVIFGGFLRR